MDKLTQINHYKMFDGHHERYQHFSDTNQCTMTFAIHLPPITLHGKKVPVLYWLSGLTCTDENFAAKAHAQQFASQHGIALVMPDTSPRVMARLMMMRMIWGKAQGFVSMPLKNRGLSTTKCMTMWCMSHQRSSKVIFL